MIFRYNRQIIGCFLLLGIASVFFASRLNISYDVRHFMPRHDADLQFYEDLQDKFKKGDDHLFIAVSRTQGVFERGFLQKVHDFTLDVREIQGVNGSESLTTIRYPLITPFGFREVAVLHPDEPSKFHKEKKRILEDERLNGVLIAQDTAALGIVIYLQNDLTSRQKRELIAKLKQKLPAYAFESWHMLGESLFQTELTQLQENEMLKLGGLAAFMSIFMLALLFRRMAITLIGMISVLLSAILFMGFLGLSGAELTSMASLYPALMVIVGTSDVVHISLKYIREIQDGAESRLAMTKTIKEIGLATLLTSLTTAAGFAAMAPGRVMAISNFGFRAAIGVMIAFITTIFFTTSLLSLLNPESLKVKLKISFPWTVWMRLLSTFTRANQRQLMMGFGLVIIVCVWGVSRLNVDFYFGKTLPKNSRLSADLSFFEENFGGYRTIEFLLTAKDTGRADDLPALRATDKFEQHLRSYPEISAVHTHSMMYKGLNQASNGNNANAYRLPTKEDKCRELRTYASIYLDPGLISNDARYSRIFGRIRDVGSKETARIGQSAMDWVSENLGTEAVIFRQTGTAFLLDKHAVYIREGLLKGMGIAVLVVSLIMGFVFKNVRMVLISLIPNLFPLLLAAAFMGFAAIELNASFAIIFTIIFGIAVDDTIHFLARFRIAQQAGKGTEASIVASFMESGKAICFTSLVLLAGFFSLLFSSQPTNQVFGMLMCITLIGALFSDLLILPILVRYFYNRK